MKNLKNKGFGLKLLPPSEEDNVRLSRYTSDYDKNKLLTLKTDSIFSKGNKTLKKCLNLGMDIKSIRKSNAKMNKPKSFSFKTKFKTTPKTNVLV